MEIVIQTQSKMKCVQLKDVFGYKDSNQWLAEEVSGKLLMSSMSFFSFIKVINSIQLFTFRHLIPLDPCTFANFDNSTIWVRGPCVSIQNKFWGSLGPTQEVPQRSKILNYV